ncbi:Next to BRCA1 gene 1 protein [Nibea albiflora]|uniref:Next to BRCA1 gene 1 protein n=1 Tax=Nibea albiflora TaxID=240163 RepID=A0ACB7F4C2_NIBAL|nr:Next to BRCA1 gene 1 protein [Nibea albiflora]
MGLPVTIKVNFRGNVKRFLAQDLDKLEWESVEAWIKASFGINHFQVKYFDEDNEEVKLLLLGNDSAACGSFTHSRLFLPSAEKQGNQLHMNVYKMKGQACGGPLKTEVKELKGDLRPAPPYPSRVKTVDKGTQVTPEREAVTVKDTKGSKPEDEPPPMWFRSYMEKFKDEVVKEVVERMCSDFSGQCCTHKTSDVPHEAAGASGGPIGPRPGPSTSNGSLGYTPNCSSCNKLTSEGAYKCSVCPSCILCEMCRHSHDPSHNLVRTKTPLSIPEHGMSGELRGPGVSHTSLVPTMAALFLDENLPDGTRLEPGTKFIKYWKMRNSGTISWTSETKLVFMWGNLGLASEEKREVPVPLLLPGQKEELRPVEKEKEVRSKDGGPGLSVDLNQEDYYFPSVDLLTAQDLLSFELLDINIVQELEKVPNNTPVDLTPCISPLPHDAPVLEKAVTSQLKEDAEVTGVRKLFGVKLRQQRELLEPVNQEDDREEEISGAQFLCETVIRSLTLEEAPDHRPPMRRAQHSSHKPQVLLLVPTNENLHLSSHHDNEDEEVMVLADMQNMRDTHEEKEEGGTRGEDWEEVSSQTSSVSSCDDYIIVLPDCFDTSRPLGESMYSSAMSQPDTAAAAALTSDDPDDRQEWTEEVNTEDSPVNTWPPIVPSIHSSVNQMLCASQTLDAVTLTPEVVPPPVLPDPLLPPPALYSPRSEALYLAEDPSPPACEPYEPPQPRVHLNVSSGLSRSAGSASSAFETYNPRPSNALQPRGQGGITEGLVKGALSVAASAYKALFTGPNCSIQRGIDPATRQDPSMMAMLLEMGFRDQRLNQRLLRKHGYSLLHTVNELVQMAEDSQNKAVNTQH